MRGQVLVDGIPIITRDAQIARYDVATLWSCGHRHRARGAGTDLCTTGHGPRSRLRLWVTMA